MTVRKKIMPALLSLDRAVQELLLRTSPGESLPGGAAELARRIDALSEVATRLRLTRLTREEVQLFTGPGYAGQDLLSQALEVPLARSAEAQAEAQARPEEASQLRALLGQLVRARGAGQAIATGTDHARRYVAGLLAYACLRLVDEIEGGLRGGGQDAQALLAETAELRARVRAYLARRDAAARENERLVGSLTQEAERAEAAVEDALTVEALRAGARPADADVLRAAERLTAASAPTPAPLPGKTNRRRDPR